MQRLHSRFLSVRGTGEMVMPSADGDRDGDGDEDGERDGYSDCEEFDEECKGVGV